MFYAFVLVDDLRFIICDDLCKNHSVTLLHFKKYFESSTINRYNNLIIYQ